MELLDPREKKVTWEEGLLSEERRVKRVPWACLVPLGETAAKACGGSQESRESRGCLARWACGDSKDHLDSLGLLDTLELLVSKESGEKREPEEKRGSEAWMGSLGSVGRQESRGHLALLAWQDPRDRRVTWGRRDLPAYLAPWCRERA